LPLNSYYKRPHGHETAPKAIKARKSKPHRCYPQIHLEHLSHLLPPEGDHRKRGDITEHTQKCKGKLVQFKTYHGIKEQVLKQSKHATQEA